MRAMRNHAWAPAGGLILLLTVLLSINSLTLGSVRQPVPSAPLPQIPPCQTSFNSSPPENQEKLLDSLVIVQNGSTIGSGVVISPQGHVLTAAHLLPEPSQNAKQKIGQAAAYLNSGEAETVPVIYRDSARDVAILKLAGSKPPCLSLRPNWLPIGSLVYSAGFSTAKGGRFLFNQGRVLAYHQSNAQSPAFIETSLNLLPGSSGGPLLDQKGQVIGIISWKAQTTWHSTHAFAAVITPLQQNSNPQLMRLSLK